MDTKLKNEVKGLVKIGLPENLAIITASANQGKPELAKEYLNEMIDEQLEIKSMLDMLLPMTEIIQLQKDAAIALIEKDAGITIVINDE